MRRYLIDHARGRPGVVHLEIEGLENLLPAGDQKTDLALAVDQLLEELGQTKPELVQVVEMKYFLGLSNEEVADALGLTVRTMQRRWSQARNWLFERMETVRVERQAR
jgi:DNA-directed RNA polymerase specialized sigma24 family protein